MNTTDSAAPSVGPLSAAVRGWDRFWFHPADPTLLGLIRILTGLIALYVHIAYTPDLLDFFGEKAWVSKPLMDEFRREVPTGDRSPDWTEALGETADQRRAGLPPLTAEDLRFMERWDGVDPRLAARHGYFAWSIWYHVSDPTWVKIIHAGVLVVFFMFTIGFCTRVVSVLAWLAALSYIQRHYTAFFGMDTIISFVLLYLMIGPSGAALSVDRLIQRYAHAWRALRARASMRKGGLLSTEALRKAEGTELDRPTPSITANLALRMIQIHICIVYFASGTSKLMGSAWWNGTAIWGTMVNPEFSPVHNDIYMNGIRLLCEHRWLWELFMSSGALFTLLFEIGFPFLIWQRPTRWLMIASAVMLHTGIAYFMGLTTFSLIMITAVFSFVPPEAIARLFRWLTRGDAYFRLGYAAGDRDQVRAASMVRAVDVWNQVQLVDQSAPREEGKTEKPAAGPLQLTAVESESEYSGNTPEAGKWRMMRRGGLALFLLGSASIIIPYLLLGSGLPKQLDDLRPYVGGFLTILGAFLYVVGVRRGPAGRAEKHLEAGKVLTGYALFEQLVRSIPLLRPVAALTYVPGVAALGRSRYPERTVIVSALVKDERIKTRGETVAH